MILIITPYTFQRFMRRIDEFGILEMEYALYRKVLELLETIWER